MRYLIFLLVFIMSLSGSAVADYDYETVCNVAMATAQVQKLEFQENPFKIIHDGLLKITTPKSEFINLHLNPIQQKLQDRIEKDWKAKKPIRYWILKARREGISTDVEANIFCLTAFRENVKSYIISKDSDQATTLFAMSKLYYDEMKEHYPVATPDFDRNNAKELNFLNLRSLIRIKSAKDATAGRGDTYQLVHLSEVAFWDRDPATLMLGLEQAISDVPYTMIIGETTANGMGGYFYEQWDRAVKEYSDWTPIFFSWMEFSDYIRPFESIVAEKALKRTLGKDYHYNEFVGEENELIEKYACNLHQLNWRRYMIRNKCKGDLDYFHQEYPAYPEQAFLVSGRPRFNVKILSKMKTTVKKPVIIGFLTKSTEGKVIVEENGKGYVKIFELPKVDEKQGNYRRYVLGGDVAEGILPIEGKKDSDFSSLHILDRRTLEQVAVWHGRIDPDLLGLEAIKLAKYYNNAFMGIERNNSGLTTVTRIKNENYWNVYQTTTYDAILDQETKKLGWVTSTKTKPLMIDELAQMIREMTIKINDLDTIQECMTYVIDEDGKTNAQQGCFDDRVIGLAIAGQMLKAFFDLEDKQDQPEDTEGTFAYYKKQIEEDLKKPVIV